MSEASQPVVRSADVGPTWLQARWLKLALAVLEPLSVAGLFVFLLVKSWLRWSDPLIDFPRDLYIAWRLSEGDLLYQKIANWYGPLANLVEGAGFRVFGVGMDTIVWMNIVLTVIVLLLLRSIFGAIGNRLMVWLGSVVFLTVFAFGHTLLEANYNFITPYVAQSTYSFLGLVVVLWGLLQHLKTERPFWLGVVGLGLAVAYLDKPEGLLGAAGALGIFLLAHFIRLSRQGATAPGQCSAGRWFVRAVAWLCLGFLCLWLPAFVYLSSCGGWAYAWRATNYVPCSLLGGSFRGAVVHSPAMQKYFGFDAPWENFVAEFKMAGELMVVCLGMVWAAREWARARAGSMQYAALLLGVAAPVLTGIWLAPQAAFWANIGAALVFPVCLASAGYAARCLWMAGRGRAEFKRVLGLAMVGVAASLMLMRMILNGRINHYGFFLMPMAMLFWIHLIVVEAARPGVGSVRANWLLPVAFSAIVLLGSAALGRFSLGVYAQKTYEVGEGRDRLYTFPIEIFAVGVVFKTMMAAHDVVAPQAKTLLVLPEGIAVNYHLRIPTPLAELEFNPLALSYVGPGSVLAELKAHQPDAVFLFARDWSPDGEAYFGADEASGGDIVRWLNDEYQVAGYSGVSPFSVSGHTMDFYLPKTVSVTVPAGSVQR